MVPYIRLPGVCQPTAVTGFNLQQGHLTPAASWCTVAVVSIDHSRVNTHRLPVSQCDKARDARPSRTGRHGGAELRSRRLPTHESRDRLHRLEPSPGQRRSCHEVSAPHLEIITILK